jgi:serine/threonine-protein kinase
MIGVNLGHACLQRADLTAADLREAHFNWASLASATLQRANLAGADLLYADLSRADLSDAILENADLRGSRLLTTQFLNARLSGIKVGAVTVDDWYVAGAECTHLYETDDGKRRTPHEGNFEPGEFQRRYTGYEE